MYLIYEVKGGGAPSIVSISQSRKSQLAFLLQLERQNKGRKRFLMVRKDGDSRLKVYDSASDELREFRGNIWISRKGV